MRYGEFRDQLQDALHEAGLFSNTSTAQPRLSTSPARTGAGRSTSIETRQSVKPFYVSAKISFRWSAADAARGHTCEEDLLTELLGRRMRLPKTQRRWTRVDLELYATLPYGSTTPIPDPKVFGSWTSSVGEKLDKLLTDFQKRQGRIVAVMGSREEVEIEAKCKAEGDLSLGAFPSPRFSSFGCSSLG